MRKNSLLEFYFFGGKQSKIHIDHPRLNWTSPRGIMFLPEHFPEVLQWLSIIFLIYANAASTASFTNRQKCNSK
jgi:hypothetical protein